MLLDNYHNTNIYYGLLINYFFSNTSQCFATEHITTRLVNTIVYKLLVMRQTLVMNNKWNDEDCEK